MGRGHSHHAKAPCPGHEQRHGHGTPARPGRRLGHNPDVSTRVSRTWPEPSPETEVGVEGPHEKSPTGIAGGA